MIAVDDENGDNEGDLIMAATLVNPRAIAFMIRHGSGIVSVGMKEEDLERLKIPMMSPITQIEDLSSAASTVTVVNIEFQEFTNLLALVLVNKLLFLFYFPSRMPEWAHLLVCQPQIGQKQFLLFLHLILIREILEDLVMCFLSSIEMVVF